MSMLSTPHSVRPARDRHAARWPTILILWAVCAVAAAAQPLAPGVEIRRTDLTLRLHQGSDAAQLQQTAHGIRIESAGRLEIEHLEVQVSVEVVAAELRLRDQSDRPLRFRAHGDMRLEAGLIDIAALAHADSWVESAGDLTLSSARPVRGDAHFRAGGSIRFVTPEGVPQSLESPLDPILLALGDVSLFNYVGASLHILAGGSIDVTDQIRITAVEADPLHAIHRHNSALFNAFEEVRTLAAVTLSDGRDIEVDGHLRPTIDLRAGIDWRNFDGGEPTPGWIGAGPPAALNPDPPEHAHIEVGSLRIDPGLGAGMILLTNRYRAHPGRIGDIVVGAIEGSAMGEELDATEVFIDSSRLVQTGAIDTRAIADLLSGRGGEVRVLAEGPLLAGDLDTAGMLSAAGHHQGAGDILLLSRQQSITASGLHTGFEVDNLATWTGPAGDVTLLAPAGHITLSALRVFAANINTFNDPSVIVGDGGNIRVEAQGRLIAAELELLARAFAPHGQLAGSGGRVEVETMEGDVNLLRVLADSFAAHGNVVGSRGIRLRAGDGAVRVTDPLSTVTTEAVAADGAVGAASGSIDIEAAGDVEIAGSIATRVTQLGPGSAAAAGDIQVHSLGGDVVLGGSASSASSGHQGAGKGGHIDIQAHVGGVHVHDLLVSATSAYGSAASVGRGGDIDVRALGSVQLAGLLSTFASASGPDSTHAGAGDIRVESTLGDIAFTATGMIRSGFLYESSGANATTGAAGAIDLLAPQGTITLPGAVTSANHNDMFGPTATYSVGDAGSIRILARDGVLAPPGTRLLAQALSGNTLAGRGGDIEVVTASGNLGFEAAWSFAHAVSGDAGAGGSILLRTDGGSISLTGSDPLRSHVVAEAGAALGSAGEIELRASDAIVVPGSITSYVQADDTATNAGSVRFISSGGAISSAAIRSDVHSATHDSGHGGAVWLEAGAGIQAADITSSARPASGRTAGRGGDIRVLGGGPVQVGTLETGMFTLSGHSAGSGDIRIETSQGDIAVDALLTRILHNLGASAGATGDIRVVASQGRVTGDSPTISTDNQGVGAATSAGSIHIEAALGIQWPDSTSLFASAGSTLAQATGPAGHIRVIAGTGDLRMHGAYAQADSEVGTTAPGAGIELRADAGAILLSGDLDASATAADGVVGTTGAVTLEAAGSVQVQGQIRNFARAAAAGAANDGSGPVSLLSDQEGIGIALVDNSTHAGSASGAAGGVTLRAENGSVTVADDILTFATATAAGGSAGRGGDVEMLSGGDLVVHRVWTSMQANVQRLGAGATHAGAGTIELTSLSGNIDVHRSLFSGFGSRYQPTEVPFSTGPAGAISLLAPAGDIRLASQVIAENDNSTPEPNPSVTGRAGDIRIEAGGTLETVGDQPILAHAFTRGQLVGRGGDVIVSAGQGDLDFVVVWAHSYAGTGDVAGSGSVDLRAPQGAIRLRGGNSITTYAWADNGHVSTRSGPITVSGRDGIDISGLVRTESQVGGSFNNAGSGSIVLLSEAGDVRAGPVWSSASSVQGSAGPAGALSLSAPQGDVVTFMLDARSVAFDSGAAAQGGNIEVLAGGRIGVGTVDSSSASQGSAATSAAGAILLRAGADIEAGSVRANSSAFDGTAEASAPAGRVELDGVHVFAERVEARGAAESGEIHIHHGGNGLLPFAVDAVQPGPPFNGTWIGLFTTDATIEPTQSFLYSHHQPPNIWIVSVDAPEYPVGGTVSGLSGSGLVLRNNGGDDLAIGGNGPFEFAAPVIEGGSYAVIVHSQPNDPPQSCSVANGSGTVSGGPVTDVQVTCVEAYTIGGTVSGLQGTGLTLLNNGGDALPVTSNGAFIFAAAVAPGDGYAVSIGSAPVGQTCSVANGSGTASNHVTDVAVSCVTDPEVDTHPVGGSVSGLQGTGLLLRNNGGDDLPVASNGAFVFATALTEGSSYMVTIAQQPIGQSCAVANAGGTVSGPVGTVAVICTTEPGVDTYTIGGTLSGLQGTGLVLTNNGGDALPVLASGAFVFATELTAGSVYNVQVFADPAGQTCSVSQGAGIVGGQVSNVLITCATDGGVDTHTVGGTLSGLQGTGLVLANLGSDELALPGDGAFVFGNAWTAGSIYLVEVATQPVGQTCVVDNGAGTLAGDVSDVLVTCSTDPGVDTFSVGGSVSGLVGTLVLMNHGTETLDLSSDGAFAFATAWTDGSSYSVAIDSQPANQSCVLSGGTGIIDGADVDDIAVACTSQTATVTPIAGPGGSLDPGTPQQVALGAVVDFTVNVAAGYQIGTVGGSCGGTLDGTVYSTAPVTMDCTVEATFIAQTATVLVAAPTTVRLGQAVGFTAEVTGTDAAPTGGQVTVQASSGESCIAAAPGASSGHTHSYTCSISFATLGPRQANAGFTGSSSHAGSDSAPVEVRAMRFADVAVMVDDGVVEVEPGAAVDYLVELRNVGPDAAPGTLLTSAFDVIVSDTAWTCAPVGAAACPTPSGSGDLDLVVDLPPGSGLDIVVGATLPMGMPSSVALAVESTVDGASPNFVHDPNPANNVDADVNVTPGVFRDGFEVIDGGTP